MRIVAPDTSGIAEALAVLKAGGVIAHATETCYGLACDLRNPEAVKKLFAIKNRPAAMPVSALFSSIEEAKKYVVWNDRAEEWAKKALPGPVTLILPIRGDAPSRIFVTAEAAEKVTSYKLQASAGVRVSPHSVALALVEQFGSPLSTTSANAHGDANPYDPESVVECDLLINSGPLPSNPPSRVIDLTTDDSKVLRP